MARNSSMAQGAGDSAVIEVLTPCDRCLEQRTLHGAYSEIHKIRTKLKDHSDGFYAKGKRSAFRTIARLQTSCPVLLCLLVVVLSLTTVHGAPSWRAKPQDADVNLGKNVTLECGINNRGDLGMLWSKFQENGRTTSLFINDTSWNAPARYYVVPHNYGYNLVITNAERSDDTKYECNIQKTKLTAEATIVVLGKFRMKCRSIYIILWLTSAC